MRQHFHRLGYIIGFLGMLLALVALLRVGGTDQRVTDVREELLMVTQGIRLNDIRSLSTRLDGLREDLSKVSADFRSLTGEVQGARTRLDQLAKDLAGLSTKVVAMETGRLEDLVKRLGALGEELAQFQRRLGRIEEEQEKIRTALAKLDQMGQELAELRTRVTAEPPKNERLQEQLGAMAAEMAQLRGRVAELQAGLTQAVPAAPALRIGVVDAETLFVRVFLPQVAAERAALQAKIQALSELQARYAQGQLRPEAYQQEYAKLQAESLQAQARVNMAMLEKMIASPGFANLRADLRSLQAQALPLVEQVEALVKQAQVVVLNYAEFFSTLQQLQAAFQQVDQLLTQVAAVKILEVAQGLAQEQGFHLVLRTKDVVMYFQAPVTDLSGEVEKRLWPLFGS